MAVHKADCNKLTVFLDSLAAKADLIDDVIFDELDSEAQEIKKAIGCN